MKTNFANLAHALLLPPPPNKLLTLALISLRKTLPARSRGFPCKLDGNPAILDILIVAFIAFKVDSSDPIEAILAISKQS